jgi:hypothetical protein
VANFEATMFGTAPSVPPSVTNRNVVGDRRALFRRRRIRGRTVAVGLDQHVDQLDRNSVEMRRHAAAAGAD